MVITAVLIGAGSRGTSLSTYATACPDKLKIVGVADTRAHPRKYHQEKHGIADDKVFKDWTEMIKLDKFADVVIIATPDQYHKAPAVAMAKKGYNILLEKPMAVTEDDCKEIVQTCKDSGVLLAVCHVLRYNPQSIKIRELIETRAIGDVINIQLTEPVGHWHFAHSYVRGNWSREDKSTFSLLAKSCHDLDIITFWLGDSRCVKVSSFGQLTHFKAENKPEGAADRCLDCAVESTCPYSACKIYYGFLKKGNTGWPVDVLTDVPDIESVTEALKTGPYGRCVYACDNDVVDHQVVNMQFDSGLTVTFTMVACTEAVCSRRVKVYGSKGEITCCLDTPVYVYDFVTGVTSVHHPHQIETPMKGHHGADYFTLDAFVEAVSTNDASKILTGPDESLRSHLLTFAAEKARKECKIISPEY